MEPRKAALFLFFFMSAALLLKCRARKQNESCVAEHNCDPGLDCQTCLAGGEFLPRCSRFQSINPLEKVKGLPYNRYSWLTTHKSFARLRVRSSTGGMISASRNQEDSITDQLNNGVRGLMLDTYDFENDIWLCNSFGGQCYNSTAFKPLINVLNEIRVFLEGNPSEIVTLILEDYVSSPNGLTKVFDAAGLKRFWFPVARMPKNGGEWPNIDDMIQKNQRLVVFTSKSSKEVSEGIAYAWKYLVENQYGTGGMNAGSCPNRAESSPMNTTTRSLVLMNYFPDNPDYATACKYNSAPLMEMMNTCYEADGKRWPNFIAVDYYKRSGVGEGSSRAVDSANGRLICGCSSVATCKENMTFGSCDLSDPQLANTQPVIAPTAAPTAAPAANKSHTYTAFLYIAVAIFYCLLLT